MRTLVLATALLSLSAPVAIRAESRFVERTLAAVPVPRDGEFPTPESVVRTFFQAVSRNDLDSAMKCFIIRENYLKVPFRTEVDYLDSIPTRGYFPGRDEVSLVKSMQDFLRAWDLLNIVRVSRLDKARVRQKTIFLSTDPAERAKQIADYERLHSEALKLPLTITSSALHDDAEGTVITSALGATGNKVMTTNLELMGQPLEVQVRLLRIGSNWRIQNVTDIEQYLR